MPVWYLILAAVFILLYVVPDSYAALLYIRAVPYYVFVCGAIFLIGVARLLNRPERFTPYLFLLFGMAAVMVVLGLVNPSNHFDIRFFFIDLQIYLGLLGGYMLVRVVPEDGLVRTLRPVLIVSMIIGVFTLAAQIGGLFQKLQESIFNVANVLACGAPLVVRYATATSRKTEYYFWVVAIPVYILAIGVYEANRTSFMLAILVIWQIWFLRRVHRRKQLAFSVVIILIGGFTMLRFLPDVAAAFSDTLAAKFDRTVDEEWRAQEVETIFQQIGTGLIYGWGFGSRYVGVSVSISTNSVTEFAFAPHIGIIAFLQKGGIEAGLLVVIWPLVTVIGILLKRNPGDAAASAALAVFSYYTIASLSGGWTSTDLFFYGAFYSMATLPKNSRPGNTTLPRMAGG